MVDRKEKYKFDLGVKGLILESNVNMVSKQHKYIVGNVSIGEYCQYSITCISKFAVLVSSFSFVPQVLILAVMNTCIQEHDIPTLSILFSL